MDIDKVSSMITELFQPLIDYRKQLVKVEKIKHRITVNKALEDSDFLQPLLELELRVNEDSKYILAKILEQKALEFAAKIREMEGSK